VGEPELVGGRYLVRERIGAGSFGAVYRAEHRVLDVTLRWVALKRYHDPGAAQEMLREALRIERLVGRCPDPVVRDRMVHCHDAGVDDGAYLVMELVEGSIADRVGRGRQWPVATVRTWLRQICEGLAFLHDEGVLHLDVTPNNVLRTAAGTLKLGDFGCARAVAEVRAEGTDGGVLAYAAPETVATRHADARADVYTVAVLGYEMLTGRLPHGDDVAAALREDAVDLDELRRIKFRPAPAAGELAPAVAGDPLEALLLRALATSPADRPADAGELLAELDRPAGSPPPPAAPSPQRVRSHALLLGQALRAGDLDLAERLAADALAANAALPAGDRVVDVYLDLVDLALRRGDVARARTLASEGLALASCPVTWRAAGRAFAGTPTGDGFDRMWSGR
jgi:eukaryotic-like serine/threonine-protein kinase